MDQNRLIDDILAGLREALPLNPEVLREDFERHLRTALERVLARMNLVTREELEVQEAVLARTREKLEALVQKVAELEARLGE